MWIYIFIGIVVISWIAYFTINYMWLNKSSFYYDSFWVCLISIIFSILLLLVLLSYCISRIKINADIQSYFQLKKTIEIARVDNKNYENANLITTIIEINTNLVQLKYYNKNWFFDPFVPDEVDSLKFIK